LTSAIIQLSVDPADKAVRMSPNDPEAHYTRALMLVNLQRLDEAIAELREATLLRPHHYYEWLDLGVTLDRSGDQSGAVAALRESVRLAPFLAQPRWQLGNLLFRQGKYEEAFVELRLATQSNPYLFDQVLQLGWVAAEGNVESLERLVQPNTRDMQFGFSNFLAIKGRGADAAKQLSRTGEPRDASESEVLNRTLSQLLANDQFAEAYAAWLATHKLELGNGANDHILNGDFLQPVMRENVSFGWRLAGIPAVAVSIDPVGPSSAARSMRLEFEGESPSTDRILDQIVLVDPDSRYSLSFMSKSEGLVSGGPPLIDIRVAGSKASRILGQSAALTSNKGSWVPYRIEFSTGSDVSAILILVHRMACAQSPCPIFGRLWLSGFSLEKSRPENRTK
jgi:Tfp pilus assembly protein PilF